MQKTLKIKNTKWICIQEPDTSMIEELNKEYNFHEMIVEDILGINAQSKIDTSSNHFFMALTFTKYLPIEERYAFNELDVIIGENFIITTTSLESERMNNIFEEISKEVEINKELYSVHHPKNQGNTSLLHDGVIRTIGESPNMNETIGSQDSESILIKSSPYYILYRIIYAFYDKTIKSLAISGQKLLDIQINIDKKGEDVIDELISEDLDKIFIKHNFLSQEDIIDELIEHIKKLHEKQLTTYFNNLKPKLAKIIRTIQVLTEKNDSLMAAYNTFLGIKSNKSVTRLTFINSIFMPLTLIAGIGGMSERTMITGPENRKIAYPIFIVLSIGIGVMTYFLLRKYFLNK